MSVVNLGMLGSVEVHTTNGRGATPEELASRAVDKIMYVGSNAHPAIREQAEAFKGSIYHVIVYYLNEAIRTNNAAIANRLVEAGHPELVSALDTK